MSRGARGLGLASLLLATCGPGDASRPHGFDRASVELRPTDPRVPQGDFRYDANEVVESIVSPAGHFRVHFSRQGRNAVPAEDVEATGVPDYVELVAETYDEVYRRYHEELGFREPLGDAILGGRGDGGDERFDVYLLDFAGRADGAYRRDACLSMNGSVCAGHILQENDFVGYAYPSRRVATRVLASHEYFHAVQAAYDADQDVVFSEGTAVWATEKFDFTLDDFEGFIRAFLDRPDRPLDVVASGTVDPKSYGTAIFFQFLDEAFGEELIVGLLEATEDGAHDIEDPHWYRDLDSFLLRERGVSFADVFARFAVWNLYTGLRANPEVAYARGAAYPAVARQTVELPLAVDRERYFHASAKYLVARQPGREQIAAALVVPEGSEDELGGMRLGLTSVRGRALAEVLWLDDLSGGTETHDTRGADELIVLVVNTNRTTPSRRPSLCVGTPAEVAACRAAFLGAPDPPDAGAEPPDAGEAADAGMEAPDGGVASELPEDEGCGCTSSGSPSHGLLWAGVLFAALVARWRRSGRLSAGASS